MHTSMHSIYYITKSLSFLYESDVLIYMYMYVRIYVYAIVFMSHQMVS